MASRSPNDDEAFLGLRFFDLFGCGNHVSTVIVVSPSSAHKAEHAADLGPLLSPSRDKTTGRSVSFGRCSGRVDYVEMISDASGYQVLWQLAFLHLKW